MAPSPAIRAATVAACLAVLALLAFTVYGHVYADGLCCGDDASIAVAAKNLAEGNGYTTTVPFFEGRGESPFDPALSTGPTLIVPAAALIRLVGPTTWAPGFTTATMAFALLAGLWAIMRRRHGSVRALLYTTSVAVLLYVFTPGAVFIQWAVLLGEIPAALLVIVGLAALSHSPDSPRAVGLASVLFGLAVLAKILVVLTVLPSAAWLVVRLLRSKRPARDRAKVALAGLAALVPLIGFELWKIVSLGLSGYRDWLGDFRRFFDESSTGTAPEGSGLDALLDRIDGNWSAIRGTYGWAAVVLGIAVVAITLLLLARRHESARALHAARLATLLTAGGGVMLAYYLFVSNGIYRYALMGLLLWAAALPCALLGRPPVAARWVGGVAAVMILAFTADTAVGPISFAFRDGYQPSDRLVNLEATGDYIDEHRDDHQLARGWWATAADIEYVLDRTGDFVEVTALTDEERATRPLLAINRIFADYARSTELDAFAADCEPVFEAHPFRVSECPPDAGASGADGSSG